MTDKANSNSEMWFMLCCGESLMKECTDLLKQTRAKIEEVERQMKSLLPRFASEVPGCVLKPLIRYGRGQSFQGVCWGIARGKGGWVRWFPNLTHHVIAENTGYKAMSDIFDRYERERVQLSAQHRQLTSAMVAVRHMVVKYVNEAPGGDAALLKRAKNSYLTALTGCTGLAHYSGKLEFEMQRVVDEALKNLGMCPVIPHIDHRNLMTLPYIYWALNMSGTLLPKPMLKHISGPPTEREMRRWRIDEQNRRKVHGWKRVVKELVEKRDKTQAVISRIRKTIREALKLKHVEEPAIPVIKVPGPWEKEPATEKQLQAIEGLGGGIPKGLTKSSARNLIWKLICRLRNHQKPPSSSPPNVKPPDGGDVQGPSQAA